LVFKAVDFHPANPDSSPAVSYHFRKGVQPKKLRPYTRKVPPSAWI